MTRSKRNGADIAIREIIHIATKSRLILDKVTLVLYRILSCMAKYLSTLMAVMDISDAQHVILAPPYSIC